MEINWQLLSEGNRVAAFTAPGVLEGLTGWGPGRQPAGISRVLALKYLHLYACRPIAQALDELYNFSVLELRYVFSYAAPVCRAALAAMMRRKQYRVEVVDRLIAVMRIEKKNAVIPNLWPHDLTPAEVKYAICIVLGNFGGPTLPNSLQHVAFAAHMFQSLLSTADLMEIFSVIDVTTDGVFVGALLPLLPAAWTDAYVHYLKDRAAPPDYSSSCAIGSAAGPAS